ncbi:pitrilysin family protein [Hyphomonas sp. FCG-A18]|uniref:M16 family metallopeptidase n=1 Tax=Hyphomonas sp. FCG-A18 TaxID=3080019 RepID=UPI002B2E35EA|nr:pitrilysin family protein [Hyphomonas sp. FCG-A18]
MKKALVSAGLASAVLFGGAVVADDAATEAWAPAQFTLENGMEVVVLPDHRAPVVTHMVWYKVGAADEDEGKSGIAHLFEHVMFKETDDIGPEEFTSIVQRNGGRLNAFTSWDYTAYYERVAKQHLGKMMELEAERMTDLIIDEDPEGGFITERDVVKEERRQRLENNPGALLSEQVLAEFWEDHPYEITVIGLMEEVEALTPQDGIDFYKKYYSPENAILVVAGDVTAEEVRTLAEEHYGVIEPSGLVDGTRKWRSVPELTETQLITHSDPKVRQPVWYRYYNGTSMRRDRDFALALSVGLDVLGGGNTSLLYQSLVEEQKLAINVGTFAFTSLHDEGPAAIYATPSPGVSLDELETAVMAEVTRFMEEGFDDADIERVRNSMAASSIYERDSQEGMANTFGAWLAIGGTVDELLSYPDDVRSVTTEQALAAVRRVFAEDRHFIEAHLLPEDGEL